MLWQTFPVRQAWTVSVLLILGRNGGWNSRRGHSQHFPVLPSTVRWPLGVASSAPLRLPSAARGRVNVHDPLCSPESHIESGNVRQFRPFSVAFELDADQAVHAHGIGRSKVLLRILMP